MRALGCGRRSDLGADPGRSGHAWEVFSLRTLVDGGAPVRLRDGAEDALLGEVGATWPGDLKALLRQSDGFDDVAGQWEVAWRTERIVAENARIRDNAPGLPAGWVCFGDNGAGDPFAVDSESGAVHSVSAIDGETRKLAGSLSEFWIGWFAGTIST